MTTLPEVIVNNVTTGHNAHHVELHRRANTNRTFNPFLPPFNAVGDGSTSDQSAIADAVAAVSAAGGGRVGPCWNNLMDDELVLPDKVEIFGLGPGPVGLLWTADLGAGKYGVKHQTTPSSGPLAASIRDLSLYGPGAHTLGVRTADMAGVRLGPHSNMTSCYVSGFGDGVVLPGDHNRLTNCDIRNNYQGVLFPSNPDTMGNHTFVGCVIVSNTFAQIALSGHNTMDQVTFTGCHIGFGPYGIYRNDMGAGASDRVGLTGCTFTSTTFEYIGNAVIFDDTTGSGSGAITYTLTTFDRCSVTQTNDTTNFRIAARAFTHAFQVRTVGTMDWYPGTWNLSAPPGGTGVFKIGAGAANESFRWHSTPPTALGELGTGAYYMTMDGHYERDNVTVAIAGGTIAPGDALAWTSNDTVSRMVAGTVGMFAGFAINNADATAPNNNVAFSNRGTGLVNSVTVSTPGLLYPVSGNEHRVSSTPNGSAIARNIQAGGNGGGTAAVKARLLTA